MTEQDKSSIGLSFNQRLIKRKREIGGRREHHSSFIKKNKKSESMGNVPLCTRPSQNLLKLSEFVELDELIILV